MLDLPAAGRAQGRTTVEPGLPLAPSWTSTGLDIGVQHGSVVGIDGDFNGDGWNDLFIGSPKAEIDVYREGVVYVFHGGVAAWRIIRIGCRLAHSKALISVPQLPRPGI